MKKYFNIAYILPILVILIFLMGSMGCDNPAVPKPDIRKEFKNSFTPDYYGWKWNMKW